MITNNVMMIKKMMQNVIKTSKILKAKNCCAKGTDQEKLHKLRLKIVKFLHSIDYLKLYYLLKSGKVAGVVVEKPVGEAYLKQNSELTFSKIKFNEEKETNMYSCS